MAANGSTPWAVFDWISSAGCSPPSLCLRSHERALWKIYGHHYSALLIDLSESAKRHNNYTETTRGDFIKGHAPATAVKAVRFGQRTRCCAEGGGCSEVSENQCRSADHLSTVRSYSQLEMADNVIRTRGDDASFRGVCA